MQLGQALTPLDLDQLSLHAGPALRFVYDIARHLIGVRARWFHQLMGEGEDEIKSFGRWDQRAGKPRTTQELVQDLDPTWQGMQAVIHRWTFEDWDKTWPEDH
jgi:hypothetical protein